MSELIHKTAAEISDLLATGEVTSEELVAAFAARTGSVDTQVHAFNAYDPEAALAEARAADRRRAEARPLGPLDGVPVGMKDVIAVKDQPLTCSSRFLEDFRSPYDAHVTECLRAGGAIPWGRLNLDEFAMGSSTENSARHTTVNPWNLARVAGGSSGGSAAAIASGEAPLSLGSDTGGSIRQPAAFCGVVGMKPTYGLVSRYGLVAFASSLDQIGPMGRTVEDAALLLQAIVGHDARDSTSLRHEVPDYRGSLRTQEGPWKLGVPKEYFIEGLDEEVKQAVEAAIDFYREQGCTVEEVSLPHTELAVPVYYIVATAEASSNLARYDGVLYSRRAEGYEDSVDLYFKSRAEGFGPEVKRRVILGTYVLSSGYYDAYYLKAQKCRTLIREDFTKAFERVDALITPTTPTPAFAAGEKVANPLDMYLSDIFTINVNLAGLPALSMPCGFTRAGLPIGVQLIGKPLAEAELLAIANRYDRAHAWHRRRPEL